MVDGVPVRYVFADEEFLEVSTSQVPPGLGWLRVPPPAPYNVQRDSLNGWADSLDARADRYETMATSADQARRNAAHGGDDRADGENGVSAMVVVLLLIALELRRRAREAREEAETLPPG